MRQTQLAAELGVCVTTLSIWERHGIPIHGDAAERVEKTIANLEKKGVNQGEYKHDKRGYVLPLASIQSRLRGRHPKPSETQGEPP